MMHAKTEYGTCDGLQSNEEALVQTAQRLPSTQRQRVLSVLLPDDPDGGYSLQKMINTVGGGKKRATPRSYSEAELRVTVEGRVGLWQYLSTEPFASEYFERKPVLINCESCALSSVWPLEDVKDGHYVHGGSRTEENMRFIRLLFTNKLVLPKDLAAGGAADAVMTRPQIEYALENGFTLQAFGTSLWCPPPRAHNGGCVPEATAAAAAAGLCTRRCDCYGRTRAR